MPLRFGTQYQCKRLDNLGDPDWHNRRWQDIDLRVAARELDATKIDDAVDRMEAVGLARLNDTFSPIIQQAMKQLADVGVSFQGQSFTENTVGPGEMTFIITEQYRIGLVVVDFVSIRPTGVDDTAMICSVVSYDRATGALVVDPQEGYVTGSGTYADWQIRVSVTPNLDTYSRAEVDGRFDDVIDGAPNTMNTLGKIAVLIGGAATMPLDTPVLLRGNSLSDVASASAARSNLGLGNVNNTADANKPVSAAQQAAINAATAAVFPTGTTMIFFQAVVPTGWIRNTSHNDKAIRVVSGTGGTAGGVQPFSTALGRTSVDYHTLDGNELTYHGHGVGDPGHAHLVGTYGFSGRYEAQGGGGSAGMAGYSDPWQASTDARATGIGIGAAGASWGHTHGLDIRVLYIDCIIGVKS